MPAAKATPRTGHEPAPPVCIVVSRYNGSITRRLLEGALAEYESRGGDRAAPRIVDAPGTFELPALCLAAAATGRYRGVLALGCLIKGRTRHDRYIAQAAAHGLIGVTLRTMIPACFGVLTCDSSAQARQRAGGPKGNKGAESMGALLETISALDHLATAAGAPPARPDRPDKAAPANGRRRAAGRA